MWWQQWGGSVQREPLMCSREEQLWLKVSPSHRGEGTHLQGSYKAPIQRRGFNPRCALFTSERGTTSKYLEQDLGSVLVLPVKLFTDMKYTSSLVQCQFLVHTNQQRIQNKRAICLISSSPLFESRNKHVPPLILFENGKAQHQSMSTSELD